MDSYADFLKNIRWVFKYMFYWRRFLESIIISIICSLPAYLQIFGEVSYHSLEQGKLQLIFFFVFLILNYLIQNNVYKFDKRPKYYIPLSFLGYLPYVVLSIVFFFILPIDIYNLFFMPMVFFEWLGASYIVSIILASLSLFLLALITPYIRRALKNRF